MQGVFYVISRDLKISFDKRSITTTIARYTARAMKKLPPRLTPNVKNPPCTLAPPIKRNKSRYANGVKTNHVAPVKSALKIIEQISNNPRATMTDIANLTGYSRSWVAETMKRLQEQGIIKRIGSDKSGYWEIVDKDKQ